MKTFLTKFLFGIAPPAAALILFALANVASPAAAADYPAIPAMEQEIPYPEREVWRRVIGWPEECEEAYRATIAPRRSGVLFHDLGQGRKLAQITCAPGAYQGYFVFAGIETGANGEVKGRLLKFPVLESPDGINLRRKESVEVWGTVTFDQSKRKLKVLNRFRGTGDCGTYFVYSFPKGVPVVDRARVKQRCDGKGGEDPSSWPGIR